MKLLSVIALGASLALVPPVLAFEVPIEPHFVEPEVPHVAEPTTEDVHPEMVEPEPKPGLEDNSGNDTGETVKPTTIYHWSHPGFFSHHSVPTPTPTQTPNN